MAPAVRYWPKLVYAYDELQSLSEESLASPEDVFGRDEKGRPYVTLGDDPRRDLILEKCYRNSRPRCSTTRVSGEKSVTASRREILPQGKASCCDARMR